jgi:hypothetical protein
MKMLSPGTEPGVEVPDKWLGKGGTGESIAYWNVLKINTSPIYCSSPSQLSPSG